MNTWSLYKKECFDLISIIPLFSMKHDVIKMIMPKYLMISADFIDAFSFFFDNNGILSKNLGRKTGEG